MISKGLLAVALLLACAAWAKPGAGDDNGSTDLTNLNYYPHQGVFYVFPHILTSLIDQTSNSTGGVTKSGYNQVYLGASYGFGDGWRLNVNDTVSYDQISDSISNTGTESITSSAGPSNPNVTTTWRYLEDRKSRVSGDLQLSVTPSFGPKVTGDGTVDKTGNNLGGGWLAQVGAVWYWHQVWNEVSFSGYLVRNYEVSTEGTSASTTSRTEAYWNSNFTLSDRIHFDKRHFVQPSANYTPAFGHDTYLANHNTNHATSPNYVNPSLFYGYSPDPDYVIGLTGTFHQAYTNSTALSTGVDTSTLTTTLTGTVEFMHQF